MAKQKIPSNPVTELPPTSGIIDAGLFSRVHDLVIQEGKKDGDSYFLETEQRVIFTESKPSHNNAALIVFDRERHIGRCFGCRGLQEDLSEVMEPVLEYNTFFFLSCRVGEGHYQEMLDEIEVDCSYLPTEKKREIAFKVRDEVGVDKIAELFGIKGGVV